ncbi:MAG TPA: ferrochelatase [Oculatellaceae cyanobacterium]|jgi:ferrochelatase
MSVNDTSKTGILLLNMGGPAKLEDVQPFLYNLFSDPDIIKLPFPELFQKPLAYRISTSRLQEAQHNYAQMGGGSPILQFSQAQANALQADLEKRGYGKLPVYLAMRYWHPFTEETVVQIQRDGIQRLIVVPLYPHFSYTTTGSSLNELKRVLERLNFHPDVFIVMSYWDHPIYQKAVAESMQEALAQNEWCCAPEEVQLLFTAHSLPLKHVKKTKDPYPEQVFNCAKQIVETYFPQNQWDLCYQSQVGNMPWLGPQTDGVLHYYAAQGIQNVLMVAISFVSDHIETLVEIDKLYLPLAAELGIPHCHRAPALNTRSTFIQALSACVIAELERFPKDAKSSSTFPEFLQTQATP